MHLLHSTCLKRWLEPMAIPYSRYNKFSPSETSWQAKTLSCGSCLISSVIVWLYTRQKETLRDINGINSISSSFKPVVSLSCSLECSLCRAMEGRKLDRQYHHTPHGQEAHWHLVKCPHPLGLVNPRRHFQHLRTEVLALRMGLERCSSMLSWSRGALYRRLRLLPLLVRPSTATYHGSCWPTTAIVIGRRSLELENVRHRQSTKKHLSSIVGRIQGVCYRRRSSVNPKQSSLNQRRIRAYCQLSHCLKARWQTLNDAKSSKAECHSIQMSNTTCR